MSKVLHSFSELGEAMGVKTKKKSVPATRKCRKCGGIMRNIENTNVFVCDCRYQNGTLCNNTVYAAVRSR